MNLVGKPILENYINPVSFILDVKVDEEKLIYNFFYGNYFDEIREVLYNGNHVYRRTFKDRDGTVTAVYRMELDFANKSEEGMPVIHYEKIS